jgi:serine protease Do
MKFPVTTFACPGKVTLPLISLVCCLVLFLGYSSGRAVAQESPQLTREAQFEKLAEEVAALERQGNILKSVVKLVTPSVVHIDAQKRETGTAYTRNVEEAGSGVIIEISESPYIVTNWHVVSGAPLGKIKIRLADRRLMYPTKIWSDPDTDIAVLKVDSRKLVPARIGNSDKMEIGDFVLAVGSPFGLSHSVTHGIISAKGRRDLELGDDEVRYQDFFQTDAAINPGNSGGPLMNLRGEMIGINTAIASNSGGNEGIGFTIPSNLVESVASQLVTNGKVSRAFLGVHLDSQFAAEDAAAMGIIPARGAKISAITPKSPAEVGKLQIGDVVTSFNGISVDDDTHLVNLVSVTPVGKQVDVLFYRGGKLYSQQIRVGNRDGFQN